MHTAFGIDVEDVENVLSHMGHESFETLPETPEAILKKLDRGQIEKAALYGNEIEEQTDFAYAEIRDQLVALGYENKTGYEPVVRPGLRP